MLEKNALKLGVLRMLKASVSNAAIEKRVTELDDQTIIGLIRKNVKTRQDSVEAFTKGNRPELAEKESLEIGILEAYLPKALSTDALSEMIQAAIKKTGATSRKEMGLVMKEVTAQASGRVDGKTLSSAVQNALG